MPFELTRSPLEARRRRLTVVSVADVTPHYRRVLLAGPDLDGWRSPGADDHVRLFFPVDGVPQEEWSSREFTPIPVGPGVAFEFLLHDGGVAADWARTANPGDELVVGGPRGSLGFDGEPDWWLLAGDLTALPAIRRFLASVPAEVHADVIVDAADPADRQELHTPGELTTTWVRDAGALLDAIGAAPERGGDGFAFVAAEQSVVKPARDLLAARGVDLERAVVKGYWRRGLTADAPKDPS